MAKKKAKKEKRSKQMTVAKNDWVIQMKPGQEKHRFFVPENLSYCDLVFVKNTLAVISKRIDDTMETMANKLREQMGQPKAEELKVVEVKGTDIPTHEAVIADKE